MYLSSCSVCRYVMSRPVKASQACGFPRAEAVQSLHGFALALIKGHGCFRKLSPRTKNRLTLLIVFPSARCSQVDSEL